MIWAYLNVGEMCFIPMNTHNEQFNGVHQTAQIAIHLSPAVSIFSTSSFFIKHCILFLSPFLFLWYPIPFSQLVVLELHPILPAVTPLALLPLRLAFPVVTPQYSYDALPTNGKAPRAPLASAGRRTCTQSFISCILNSP